MTSPNPFMIERSGQVLSLSVQFTALAVLALARGVLSMVKLSCNVGSIVCLASPGSMPSPHVEHVLPMELRWDMRAFLLPGLHGH